MTQKPKDDATELEAIRQRHNATLVIDWANEFDPEAQPASYSNALACHADRGRLLAHIDKLQAYIFQCHPQGT